MLTQVTCYQGKLEEITCLTRDRWRLLNMWANGFYTVDCFFFLFKEFYKSCVLILELSFSVFLSHGQSVASSTPRELAIFSVWTTHLFPLWAAFVCHLEPSWDSMRTLSQFSAKGYFIHIDITFVGTLVNTGVITSSRAANQWAFFFFTCSWMCNSVD